MGDCTGTATCEDIDFYTELNAFETAYQTIPKYSFLDTSQIYIFGHSMGGVIAPLIKTHPRSQRDSGLWNRNPFLVRIFYRTSPLPANLCWRRLC